MNERIRLLATEAFRLANDGTMADIKIPKVFIDEFAQLIVQECAAIADDGFGSAHFGLGISGKMLKEHFGVDK